ncbi:MAG: hypothetical protein ACRCY4_07710 [Brevinema sp.]
MKSLFILLLLLTSCAKRPAVEVQSAVSTPSLGDSKDTSHMSPEVIVSEVAKGNFKVLDPFFDTNELFPASFVRDGYIIIYLPEEEQAYENFITFQDTPNSTNFIKFSNVNIPISYTNKYGIPFIESRQLLIPTEILTNMRDNQYSFEYVITSIEQGVSVEDIYELVKWDGDGPVGIYEYYAPLFAIQVYFRDSLGSPALAKALDFDRFKEEERTIMVKQLEEYILTKVKPNSLENLKNFMINCYINDMFKDSEAKIDGFTRVSLRNIVL